MGALWVPLTPCDAPIWIPVFVPAAFVVFACLMICRAVCPFPKACVTYKCLGEHILLPALCSLSCDTSDLQEAAAASCISAEAASLPLCLQELGKGRLLMSSTCSSQGCDPGRQAVVTNLVVAELCPRVWCCLQHRKGAEGSVTADSALLQGCGEASELSRASNWGDVSQEMN